MTEAIDLRSDTVTTPSPAMRAAMAAAEVGDDVLDRDPTTYALECEVAGLLGKESGLYFPSGSMANQTAVILHSRPGTEVLVDADSHLVHWEMAGVAALAGVQIRPVRGESTVMRANDLAAGIRVPSKHSPEASLVSLENTHNGAGGVITSYAELSELSAIARENGLPVHMDGARLWNAHIATGTSLSAFASCAHTVMVSFSKGLGAPVGAVLVGSEEDMSKAHRIRKRLGGGMRQSGILAAAARYAISFHLDGLKQDHLAAQHLADVVAEVPGVQVVSPDTNILMMDLPVPRAAEVVEAAARMGVRISQWSRTRVRAVTHRDAPLDRVRTAAPRLASAIDGVLRG